MRRSRFKAKLKNRANYKTKKINKKISNKLLKKKKTLQNFSNSKQIDK